MLPEEIINRQERQGRQALIANFYNAKLYI